VANSLISSSARFRSVMYRRSGRLKKKSSTGDRSAINKMESTIAVIGLERGGILDRRSMINATMTKIEVVKRLRK